MPCQKYGPPGFQFGPRRWSSVAYRVRLMSTGGLLVHVGETRES